MNNTSIFIIKGSKAKKVEDYLNSLNTQEKTVFNSQNNKAECHVTSDFTLAVDLYLNSNKTFFYKDLKNYLYSRFEKVDNVSLSAILKDRNYHKKKYRNNATNSVVVLWAKKI